MVLVNQYTLTLDIQFTQQLFDRSTCVDFDLSPSVINVYVLVDLHSAVFLLFLFAQIGQNRQQASKR